jgi:hypothetical protein
MDVVQPIIAILMELLFYRFLTNSMSVCFDKQVYTGIFICFEINREKTIILYISLVPEI